MPNEYSPIRDVLTRLREHQGLTVRGIEAITESIDTASRDYSPRRSGKRGLRYSHIANLANGTSQSPTVGTMQLLAAALDVDPNVFTEYQLAQLRARFDPAEVGFERACENLAEYKRRNNGEAS